MCLACTYGYALKDHPDLNDRVLEVANKWATWISKYDGTPDSHIPKMPSPEWFMISRYILLRDEYQDLEKKYNELVEKK